MFPFFPPANPESLDLKQRSYSIAEASNVLKLDEDEIFDTARAGYIRLFVDVPDDIILHLSHQDALKPTSIATRAYRAGRGVCVGEFSDSPPRHVSHYGIDALFVTQKHLNAIYDDGRCKIRTSPMGFAWNGPFISFPTGFMNLKSDLGDVLELWSHLPFPVTEHVFCAYKKDDDIIFDSTDGFTVPSGFDIKRESLYILKEDIQRYLNRNSLETFIGDLLKLSERPYKMPIWVSDKLKYLFKSFYECWSGVDQYDQKDQNDAHENFKAKLHSDEFCNLFMDKREIDSQYLERIALLFQPEIARFPSANKGSTGTNIPLEAKVLLAGAKLFWGDERVDLDDITTHFKVREKDFEFWKSYGIRGNDRSLASTIIRPESARGGGGKGNSKKRS